MKKTLAVLGAVVLLLSLFGTAGADEWHVIGESGDPPASNIFGNPSLPDWKDVTVEDTDDFVIVNNADGFEFKFRKGTVGTTQILQDGIVIIEEESWVVEYLFNAPDTWKTRGEPQHVEWEQPENYHVIVKRYYRDWGSPETTFWVVYDFYGGFRPKISVEMSVGQEDNYRIAWKASGINKTHVAENFNYVRFWNENEGAVVFDYSDVYETFGDITEVEIEEWAGNHKLNEYFYVGSLGIGGFVLDPNFGYEEIGTNLGSRVDTIFGSWFTCPEDGTADNINVYLTDWDSGENIKCALYTATAHDGTNFTGNFVTGTDERADGGSGWQTFTFSSPPSISASTEYWIVCWSDNSIQSRFNIVDDNGMWDAETYDSWPSSITGSTLLNREEYEYSIYCSYTAGAPPAPGKPVLVSPENSYSTSDNTPTFKWENGSDATSHRLVIDNSENFDDGDNIYDNASAWDNSGTTIENELPVDNYWWKVAAVNAQGENWSENTWTFEVTAATYEWQLVETWTGTIEAPAEWHVTETWTGTIQAPAEWHVTESWTAAITAQASWNVVEDWTASISTTAEWHSVEEWSGTLTTSADWHVTETWTGTVQAPAEWQVVESWTGTVSAPAPPEWKVTETWIGTISAPVQWHIIETWTGTIETMKWNIVETWSGTINKITVPPAPPERWEEPHPIVMIVSVFVLMALALTFDSPVLAFFGGMMSVFVGLMLIVDTPWVGMIFLGLGIYFILIAVMSEE